MSLDILSKDTGGSYSGSPGYFVGGYNYGVFFAIPFKNSRNGTIILKSLTLPLAYWSENGSARTVQGAVWLASKGPIDGASDNVMDLYAAAKSNLTALRNRNNGSVSGSKGYSYWYSPFQGLSGTDQNKVLGAMLYSTNTHTPTESVDRDTQSRAREYTFYFNDIEIPSGTYFYVGLYSGNSGHWGANGSIAIRRLGYSSTNRNGSLDQKYNYERNTMVAANYVNDYRGRWHFYNGYFTNTNHPNNYAQGVVDAKITVTSPYSIPTISITSTEATTRHDVPITINYSTNSASGNQGSTYVQYSINEKAWTTVSGSSNSAGSFTYTPSSYGVGDNTRYTVRVRRICSNSDFDNVSENDGITMYTYKAVTMSGFKVSPASTVNGNTDSKLEWNASDEGTTSCKIEVFSGNTLISTIASNLANSTVSKIFTPSSYIGIAYDNTDLTIKITRTSSSSGYTASQSIPFKVLYRPTGKVSNISPANLGIISDNKNITWAYPSTGYTGIVSGYNVTLTNTKGHVVNYNVSTNSCNIKVADLNPSAYYNIGIRPYYQSEDTKYYGSYTEISNYLYYDKGIATPVITYPISSKWVGNTYRVVFDLPEDYNYDYLPQEIKTAYRYKDVEVNINNISYNLSSYPNAFSLIQSNLTHKSTIVFSPSIIGIQAQDNNIIKVRAKSYFDNWSKYSNSVTIVNTDMNIVTIGDIWQNLLDNYKDWRKVLEKTWGLFHTDIIYFTYCNKFFSLCNDICKAYDIKETFPKSGDVIYASDINKISTCISAAISKVNSNTFDNNSVKFKTLSDPVSVSQDDIILLSHFKRLIMVLGTIFS